VVADKRDLTNFGNFFHEAVFHSSRPALLRTRVCAPTANVPPQREESTLPGVENPLAGAREGYSGRRVIVSMSPPSYLSVWLQSLQIPLLFHLAKSLYLAS
jgi:hypothetical protein